MDNILEVRDLKKYYPIKSGLLGKPQGQIKAVDGVSFSIKRGSTMGLVGESGCGKSTTGRMILRLAGEKTDGQILFNGQYIYALSRKQLRALRPKCRLFSKTPFPVCRPVCR